MKKGRKPKDKLSNCNHETGMHYFNIYYPLLIDKGKRLRIEQNLGMVDESFEDLSMKIGGLMPDNVNLYSMDSEVNLSIDRPEINYGSKSNVKNEKTPEKGTETSQVSVIAGPITRRKEFQNFQHAGRGNCENSEMSTLKKFDDFYKDRKNVENEIYYYHAPRVDKVLYQASLAAYGNQENKLINENVNPMGKYFEYDKISKDDLNYYMKFITYYKNSVDVGNGNFFLKGVHNFEQNSLMLLKECSYDINLALTRILFPLMEVRYTSDDNEKRLCVSPIGAMKPSTRDPMLYVNSALNDLIGSNIQEKEQWLEYVSERLNSKIEFSELQQLVELGNKMKIDIPDFVIQETENSMAFAKIIRRHLNEKNTLRDVTKLVELSETYKVRTEEFTVLEDTIKKAENWIKRVVDIENKCISFKALQGLYNEGKNLPIKFDGNKFEYIKQRYTKAQQWQEAFSQLPKHSKTRQQGNNGRNFSNERCTLAYLAQLLKQSEEINFTSNEVISLRNNFEKLREAEARISMTLEDSRTPKTKELLIEFANTLDSLRFTTDLFDLIISKLEFLEWKEKKDYYLSNKIVKTKHLKSLIKMANQKYLNIFPEIQHFKETFQQIEEWIERMSSIFYFEDSDEEVDGDEKECDQENVEMMIEIPKRNSKMLTKHSRNKISENDLSQLYNIGKNFDMKPEEVEYLLSKCEEVFDFISECKTAVALSQNNSSSGAYDYQKLSSFLDQIMKYSIKCEEFEIIEAHIALVQKWIESCQEFLAKFRQLNKDFAFNFEELASLEMRQEIIEILENFLRKNTIFYENLSDLIAKVPHFAKSSKEYAELMTIKEQAEAKMNTNLNAFTELKALQNFICESRLLCVKKSFFAQLLCLYRAKSWAHIASLKKKMSIVDAESMVKEASNLNLNTNEVENIKQQILKTKEWIKQSKRIVNWDKISYEMLKNFINDGASLPLHTEELEDLFNFQASLENDIFQARSLLQNESRYEEFAEFAEKIGKISVEVEEFELVTKLKTLCDEWRHIAEKILSSRRLCTLYFKPDKPNSSLENTNRNNNTKEKMKMDEDEEIIPSNDEGSVMNSNLSHNQTYLKNKNKRNPSSSQMENEIDSISILSPNQKNQTTNGKNFDTLSKNSLRSNSPGQNDFFHKIENANINIINNNYYFNDATVKKKPSKATKREYENVLNIINTMPNPRTPVNVNIPNPNSKSSLGVNILDKINLKKFNNFSYEEKLNLISQTVVLKTETEGECYCICRRGDDSVNYMVMCENCKEWFHGQCLNIQQATADKISQYICLACSRRKDLYGSSYHHYFFHNKRISWEKFLDFLTEGELMPIALTQIEKFKGIKEKVIQWLEKYNGILKEIIDFISIKNSSNYSKILNEETEKKLIDLYLESEGFPVEIESALNIILILKHYDWFRDAYKCVENKKFSEKMNKKVLSTSFQIFNKDFIPIKTENEKIYFEKIIDKSMHLLNEICMTYEKYSSIVSAFKPRHDHKKPEDVDQFIMKIEDVDDLQNNFIDIKDQSKIVGEINEYQSWTNLVKDTLSSPNLSKESFNFLIDKSRSFHFQSGFLEKFRLISQNFIKEQADNYLLLLFGEGAKPLKDSKLVVTVNKVKKGKKEDS